MSEFVNIEQTDANQFYTTKNSTQNDNPLENNENNGINSISELDNQSNYTKNNLFGSMVNRIKRLSIKTKWMFYTFIFIFIFSFILVSFFLTTGKKGLEKDVKKWGHSLTDNLVYSVQAAVLTKDYHTLNSYLYGIMNHAEILYSAIIDHHSSYLALQDPKAMLTNDILNLSLSSTYQEVSEFQTSDGLAFYNIVKRIRIDKDIDLIEQEADYDPMERAITEYDPKRSRLQNSSSGNGLGTVIVGISLENMKIKLNKMRNKAIYITFVTALFFTVFVFWGVEKITAPIKNLDKATHRVALGDLNHVVENDRVDELGRLAESFNEMILKLKQSQQEINRYTQTLEKTVDERTYELRISEQNYRTLFEHAGTAVALIDNDGQFIMVNKGFEALSGYSKQELEEKLNFSDFLASDDCKKIKRLCNGDKNKATSNFPIIHECTFIDRSHNPKKINLTISIIPDTLKLLVSIVEVTELRNLQKRLARSEQLAILGELSASIAHEIRNPLVAIHTSVGILNNALDLSGEDKELMSIISEESLRLNKIVDDFLKFARPNEPQFSDTDIRTLIEDTLVVLGSRFNKRIKKNIQLDKDVPMVAADRNQLKQVFMNMFINAIEAMPSGGTLSILTRLHKNRNGYKNLEVVIKDTGKGIEKHELKKIFQPFYSNKVGGVGMGLAVCERIIQNHGGIIRVESEFGNGAEFTIVVPVER